jgi:hypothetical protein
LFGLRCFARSLWKQGVTGKYRAEYWRFIASAVRVAPRRFGHTIALAIVGEHMIRFTSEDVLPALKVAPTKRVLQPPRSGSDADITPSLVRLPKRIAVRA